MTIKRVVIDLETLGVEKDSIILQVGLAKCVVDDEGRISDVETLDLRPNLSEQHDRGRTWSVDTLTWWADTNPKKFAALALEAVGSRMFTGVVEIEVVGFLHDADEVWGNSPDFDIGILEHYLGKRVIHYRKIHDFRTFRRLIPGDEWVRWTKENQNLDPHDGVADAVHELKFINEFKPRIRV